MQFWKHLHCRRYLEGIVPAGAAVCTAERWVISDDVKAAGAPEKSAVKLCATQERTQSTAPPRDEQTRRVSEISKDENVRHRRHHNTLCNLSPPALIG